MSPRIEAFFFGDPATARGSAEKEYASAACCLGSATGKGGGFANILNVKSFNEAVGKMEPWLTRRDLGSNDVAHTLRNDQPFESEVVIKMTT